MVLKNSDISMLISHISNSTTTCNIFRQYFLCLFPKSFAPYIFKYTGIVTYFVGLGVVLSEKDGGGGGVRTQHFIYNDKSYIFQTSYFLKDKNYHLHYVTG